RCVGQPAPTRGQLPPTDDHALGVLQDVPPLLRRRGFPFRLAQFPAWRRLCVPRLVTPLAASRDSPAKPQFHPRTAPSNAKMRNPFLTAFRRFFILIFFVMSPEVQCQKGVMTKTMESVEMMTRAHFW